MKYLLPEFKITLKNKGKASEAKTVNSSDDAAEVARLCFDSEKMEWVEEFVVITLNRANRVVGFFKVSSGGVSGTVADPKVIFQLALLSNASGLILAHNHPSGNLKPSAQDLTLTEKIKGAGKLLDISIIDHIIVTAESSYSFADEGIL
jgi:DNA repair protein RadC